MANAPIVTPFGDLMWVFIDQPGKPDLQGRNRLQASLYFHKDSPELKQIEAAIEAFWDEHKPKSANKRKSNGIKIVEDKGVATEMRSVNFWSGTHFPDGTEKAIKIYNSKGSEVSLMGKKIGNGSRGAISGSMGIYSNGPHHGVALYLNAIQLTKFVELTSKDPGFSAAAGEGGFEGVENSDGFTAVEEESPRPRL